MKKFWSHNKKLIILLLLLLIPAGVLFATTFKFSFPAETVLAETDFYGGGVADLASDSAEDLTGDIDLETNGYYGMWLTIEYDASGTTNDLTISYYASYDGTNFDDIPFWTMIADNNAGADTQITLQLWPAPPHGRIGLTGGGTDTFDYQITYLPARGDGT